MSSGIIAGKGAGGAPSSKVLRYYLGNPQAEDRQ